MIPYEPWNQNIVGSSTYPSLGNENVYFIQFRAPKTGIYTKATMLVGPAVSGSAGVNGFLGMAIYLNDPSPGSAVSGKDTHGIPTTVLTEGSVGVGLAFNANEFMEVTLSTAVTLTADDPYWFAFAWTRSSGGTTTEPFPIYGGYDVDANSVLSNTSNLYTGTFASNVGVTDLIAFNAPVWFRLSA
jgi:hypothetical protein